MIHVPGTCTNCLPCRDEILSLRTERDWLKKVVARSATEGSDAARAYINDALCVGTVVGEPEWVVEGKQCGHSSPDDGHFCTRPKGHGADHYAVDPMFGNIMDRWPCGCGKPYCGACSQ